VPHRWRVRRRRHAAAVFTLTAGRRAHAFAATEHLHFVGNDLGRVALVAVLVLPLVGPDAPFDIDLAALLEILAGRLGQLAEEDDAVPFGAVLQLTRCLVTEAVGSRHPDVANRVAVGRIAGFRIRTKVADENHFIDRSHVASLNGEGKEPSVIIEA